MPGGQEHVDRELDELGRQRREALGPALGITELDDEVVALDVSEFSQALHEGHGRGVGTRVHGAQHADPHDALRWRRSGRLWHREQAEGTKDDDANDARHDALLLSTWYPSRPAGTDHSLSAAAERWRSPAAGSGRDAGADAGSRPVQPVVRLGMPATSQRQAPL